jgi:O-antigen/teichoic acid export membrane protein
VLGGKSYVLILSLALTPIISRLFTPEDYGEFALYNLFVQNLVVLGTLSLPLAISTSPKKDLNAIFGFTIWIIILFSCIYFSILFTFKSNLDLYFGTNLFSSFWYLFIFGFILTSIVSSIASINIREKRFKFNTAVNMTEATSSKLLNLIGGIIHLKALGLILSDIVSRVISTIVLIWRFPKNISLSLPNYKSAIVLLIRLKEFPLFSTPSQWLGTLSNQAIVWYIAYKFDANSLGQLSMAIALLGIPLNVLANSFQPVITERLVNLREESGGFKFFKNLFGILLIVSFTGFIIIYLIPNSFFLFFLGEKWTNVNSIVNIYCWYYILLLLDQSFANAFIIFKKQKLKLGLNLIDVLLLAIAAVILAQLNSSFLEVIIILIVIKSCISLLHLILIKKIIQNHE